VKLAFRLSRLNGIDSPNGEILSAPFFAFKSGLKKAFGLKAGAA